jgi:hypothetical protein
LHAVPRAGHRRLSARAALLYLRLLSQRGGDTELGDALHLERLGAQGASPPFEGGRPRGVRCSPRASVNTAREATNRGSWEGDLTPGCCPPLWRRVSSALRHTPPSGPSCFLPSRPPGPPAHARGLGLAGRLCRRFGYALARDEKPPRGSLRRPLRLRPLQRLAQLRADGR